MNECRLCREFLGATPKEWNRPLYESKNFVALPSLGALVEGWLLLVPKQHLISYGALPDDLLAEFSEFKAFLCNVVEQRYGSVCAFEHGPGASNRSVGCGVDHAHLHLVPILFDLAGEVASVVPEWKAAGLSECRRAFLRGDDYVYLEQPIGSGLIATGNQFGSQLLRRAIASRLGIAAQYNWREFDHLETVMATIAGMREWEHHRIAGRFVRRVA